MTVKTFLGLPMEKAVDGAKEGVVMATSITDKIGVVIQR